ncbi:hypothetical protein H8356DRAFT_1427112 [Neocallimastix lanati (nom. inval.)]|nr:hypothetical protein H8356DRAFT_1427112 [Neocallimastix sp. JGI-2020a]
MNINNKYSLFTILVFIILFLKLNYASTRNISKNKRLLLHCKKICSNKNNNRKLKKFCKKCLPLDILHKNKSPENNKIFENNENFENNKISYYNILFENKNSSIIHLSNSTKFDYHKIENLIVFGDSNSSVGTNYTDMTYTGVNHSGGKNWPLYLKDFNKMKAPIYEKLFNDSRDLKTQCDYFYENMSKGKKFYNTWNENNSIFAFWFGTIDIGFRNHNYKTVEELAKNFFNLIERMYDYGLRNILILGAPPLYRIPSHRSFTKCRDISDENCIKFLKNEVLTFNNEIMAKSNIFFNKHKDINLIYCSTVDIFENIISNCNKYKFKDCINTWRSNKKNNVNDYFWANSHLSDLANKILARDINELLSSLNKSTS